MMISHSIPGRLRLRHVAPLSGASLEELTARVRAVAPSAMLHYTPQTKSTLIIFEETGLNSKMLALFASEEKTPPPAKPPLLCWPAMGQIKRGMSASLLTSLGLAVVRREGGHAMMGGVFLGLLARHLWVYRKRLWK